jgi:hypothetical protein
MSFVYYIFMVYGIFVFLFVFLTLIQINYFDWKLERGVGYPLVLLWVFFQVFAMLLQGSMI